MILRIRSLVVLVLVSAAFAQSCAPKTAGMQVPAGDFKLWNDASASLNQGGRFMQALEAADRSIAMEPRFSYAWNNKSVALIGLARPVEALQAAERSIETKPDNALAWNNKGVALKLLGRLDDALAATDQALRFDPWNAEIHYNRACFRALSGSRADALRDLAQALSLDPRLKDAANRDEDLIGLRDDETFKELMGK